MRRNGIRFYDARGTYAVHCNTVQPEVSDHDYKYWSTKWGISEDHLVAADQAAASGDLAPLEECLLYIASQPS